MLSIEVFIATAYFNVTELICQLLERLSLIYKTNTITIGDTRGIKELIESLKWLIPEKI
jgi:hypothetical protein